MNLVPRYMFLTKGVGKHQEKLSSFEMALRDAGIARFNLVQVSSILPPDCRIIQKSKGLAMLSPGEIVFCVMAKNCSCEPNRLMASSIGVAIPNDKTINGYLSEHHSFGETECRSGDYAEDLAAEMLATVLGLKFDSNSSWDEKKEIWKMSGKIVKTRNITQSAIGNKNGLWTTVLAAAVFIL